MNRSSGKTSFISAWAFLILAGVLAGCAGDESPVESSGDVIRATGTEPAPTALILPVASEPGLSIVTADDLAAVYEATKGKVVVINFWATWCAPCVREMPELAEFYDSYKDRGVILLSLSTDDLDSFESKLRPFVEERELPFHVYAIGGCDPDDLDEIFAFDTDVALPTTFVLDQNRTVVKVWKRNIELSDLQKVIDPLISLDSEGQDPL